jgi:hypothetical protein
MWWKSIYVKQPYDVTIRLKKDQAPYIETIVIPSAYKIRMASKDSVVRGYAKEVLGSPANPITQYTYTIDNSTKKDCYILSAHMNHDGVLVIDANGVDDGTKIDFFIKLRDMNILQPNKTYIQIGNNNISGGLTVTSAIAGTNYAMHDRREMIFSMSIEKIDGEIIITAFSPMPGFIVNNNYGLAAVFNPYNGMFKDPFSG